MNDRSLMLKQPRGSRNLLVLGKYNRQLDKINVTIQIVDVANWEELGKSNISEVYSKVQILNQSVGRAVTQMLDPFLPKQPTIIEMVALKTAILSPTKNHWSFNDFREVNGITTLVVLQNFQLWDKAKSRCNKY